MSTATVQARRLHPGDRVIGIGHVIEIRRNIAGSGYTYVRFGNGPVQVYHNDDLVEVEVRQSS